MQAKITKRTVDDAQPGQKIYDETLKGFLLVVTPAGTKSYAIEYRAGSGRLAPKRRLVIGKHGSPWTPEQARKRAEKLLAEVKLGGDPAQERKSERETLTFDGLLDLYFAEGVSHKKPATLRSDRGRVENHLRPLLGKLRIDRIGRTEIERMQKAVADGRSGARGGKGVAAQCVTLASAIFTFSNKRGICDRNPARGIEKAPIRKLTRFLSETEIARLAQALDAEASATGNPFPAAAIRLLLFTGCRKGEIVGLEWQHVDFDRQCLRLPDAKESKGDIKIVHLSPPAIELLHSLDRVQGNPRVIPGTRSVGAGAGIEKAWRRVRRAAVLPDVRLHDLRHSFASIAASGGGSLLMIGKLLGHRNTATTERYAHLSDDPLRSLNDRIGERIAAAMARQGGKIVPMRGQS